MALGPRGVMTGARGAQFPSPGAGSLRAAPKSPNNVTSAFFNTVHFFPKELRFEHGGANLVAPLLDHLFEKHQLSMDHYKLQVDYRWSTCTALRITVLGDQTKHKIMWDCGSN